MIGAIIVAMLVFAALAFVAQPLRRGPRSDEATLSDAIEEAGARKRSALIAILDMEEERALGKLSETDFRVLRAQYEAEAVAALKELDAAQRDTGDAELEKEIARIKETLVCPSCGALTPEGSRCTACGAT